MDLSHAIETVITVAATGGFTWFLGRKKQKADNEKTKAETWNMFDDRYRNMIKTQDERWEFAKEEREDLKKKYHEVKHDHEQCEFQKEVLKLRVQKLERIVPVEVHRELVFVLDDNHLTLIEFKKHFGEYPQLDVHLFDEPNAFLAEVEALKPRIVVMDFRIGEVEADRVIEQMAYKPEIIIMSAYEGERKRFEKMGIRFFYKEDFYIVKIAKAVIMFLQTKN